jgi:hypothetical protein
VSAVTLMTSCLGERRMADKKAKVPSAKPAEDGESASPPIAAIASALLVGICR